MGLLVYWLLVTGVLRFGSQYGVIGILVTGILVIGVLRFDIQCDMAYFRL
jgi:hypothetical protein